MQAAAEAAEVKRSIEAINANQQAKDLGKVVEERSSAEFSVASHTDRAAEQLR